MSAEDIRIVAALGAWFSFKNVIRGREYRMKIFWTTSAAVSANSHAFARGFRSQQVK